MTCQGNFCNQQEVWKELLVQFKMKNLMKEATHNSNDLFDAKTTENLLGKQDQLNYLSKIPNSHKWLWTLKDPAKQQIKFSQKFSCTYGISPASPRNKIIRAIVRDNGDKRRMVEKACYTILKIYGDDTIHERAAKRRRLTANTEKRSRPAIDMALLCESFGISENDAKKLSENLYLQNKRKLYPYFVEKLFSEGCINWRVKTEDYQVVVMNDYDSDTGEFKVSGGALSTLL